MFYLCQSKKIIRWTRTKQYIYKYDFTYCLSMPTIKKEHPKIKTSLHPRNKHRERYNFKVLIDSCPQLAPFVKLNIYNDESIDFFDPEAVKMLNRALLKHYYHIEHWDIPQNYLCPPIPGRADYIHYVADLFGDNKTIRCLDIGVGVNCIYPIIGVNEYGWSFVGTDIDAVAIESAKKIIEMNPILKDKVELRLQNNPNDIFKGIIQKDEKFDITICNPPFHGSPAEAQAGAARKLSNLKNEKISNPILNFGGANNELWCKGGEKQFIYNMIMQSREFATNCLWFTTLVSKESHLESIYKTLAKVKAAEVKTIAMGQGNKVSRIVGWRF